MRTPFKTEKEIDDYSSLLFRMCPQRPELPLRFTGWKYGGYNFLHFEDDDTSPFVKDWNSGFVAQWVWRDPEWVYYVNLPGMQSGKTTIGEGQRFKLGTERIYNGEATQERITELVIEGRKRLMQLVSDNGIDVSAFIEHTA